MLSAILVVWFLALGVSLYPESDAIPLIGPEHWSLSGGFAKTVAPNADEIRQSIRRSPSAVFWRSWTPETGALPGRAETDAFLPPDTFVVPYGGFPGDPGIRLYVECLSDGATWDLTRARTNTQSAEAFVRLPKSWCAGAVRVVAQSDSTRSYVTVGTPFKVGVISLLKQSFVGTFALAVAAFGVLLVFVLAGHAAATAASRPEQGFFIGIVVLGVVSYVAFFVFFASATAGRIYSIALLAIALTYVVRRWRIQSFVFRANQVPYLIWGGATLGYLALLYAASNGGGSWEANSRFLPVRWSSDNQLPYLTANALFRGLSLADLPFGSWKVSDRPPLMSGAMVLARMLGFLAAGDDGRYRLFALYQCTGIALNALLVPVVYLVLRNLSKSGRVVVGGVLLVATSPFVMFNVVYIWPKICAGMYAILAFALLVQERGLSQTRVAPVSATTAAIAGMAFGLSLMSHGGAVFGIVVLAGWSLWAGYLGSVRTMVSMIFAAVLIVLPWSLWQHLVQPPGNALVKLAFAGTAGWGEEELGVAATIVRAYSSIDLSTWLTMKAQAFGTLFGVMPETCGTGEMSEIPTGSTGVLRIADFLYVGPSLRVSAIGVAIGLAFALRFVRVRQSDLKRPAFAMLALGALPVLLSALGTWDCHIVHHQSYQAIVFLFIGAWLSVVALNGTAAGILLGLSLAYSGTVWVAIPIFEALHRDYFAIATLLMVCVYIAYEVARSAAKRAT